jgi:hypothetical protein
MGPSARAKLEGRVKGIVMEQTNLLDAGSLLLRLRSSSVPLAALAPIKSLLQTFELENPKTRREAYFPVLIRPEPDQGKTALMYGLNDWTLGDQDDGQSYARLSKDLFTYFFLPGPNGKIWPVVDFKELKKPIYTVPFFPNASTPIRSFNARWVNPDTGEAIGSALHFERVRDFSVFEPSRDDNPIRFSGHTHGIGAAGERYTGLSIANPQAPIKNKADYEALRFHRETGWGEVLLEK